MPCQLNSISISQQIAIEAIKVYSHHDDDAAASATSTRNCNLVARPRGAILMSGSMQSKPQTWDLVAKTWDLWPGKRVGVGVDGGVGLCWLGFLRSTEAVAVVAVVAVAGAAAPVAAPNDCYYIYRPGHYNKISKNLAIIQFESNNKSACKRATNDNKAWRFRFLCLVSFYLLGWGTVCCYCFVATQVAIWLLATPLSTGSQRHIECCNMCDEHQRAQTRIRTHHRCRYSAGLLHPLEHSNFHTPDTYHELRT